MSNLVKNQPVISAFLAEVTALIALLVAFGVDLTDAQIAAITGFVGASAVLTGLVWKAVTPVSKGGKQ